MIRFVRYSNDPIVNGAAQRLVNDMRPNALDGQDYEVRYEARKTGKSRATVKKAVGKVGDSRKKVERRLASG
jgi:hypothetical protein